ncbi:MAG TPA: fibronectin type III domain-containing protein [Solirubrobacteraceae bacterium]|nr:fibronectin type III domain-containing protein [Solirubrobacteraceae bacterium]
MRVIRVIAMLAVLGLLFVASAAASAGGAPTATTGTATSIGASGATLNGTVDPNKQSTTYSFQYGPTTAYGKTTPVTTVAGNAGKSVSAAITGLAPMTVYHFRVTATNASGQAMGQDVRFTTTAVGTPPPAAKNAVGIGAVPGTVTYGRSAVLSGAVTGPKSGGVQVILKAQPYPFTAAFKATGAVTTSASSGRYSFTVAPRVRTRYEVLAKTPPPVTSRAITVGVRYAVGFFVSSTAVHRGARVRFSGSVRPSANGRTVLIQRRSSTGVYRTVARALLHATTSKIRSSYSTRLRIRSTGIYRVRMPAHTPYAAGNSRSRRISVR